MSQDKYIELATIFGPEAFRVLRPKGLGNKAKSTVELDVTFKDGQQQTLTGTAQGKNEAAKLAAVHDVFNQVVGLIKSRQTIVVESTFDGKTRKCKVDYNENLLKYPESRNYLVIPNELDYVRQGSIPRTAEKVLV